MNRPLALLAASLLSLSGIGVAAAPPRAVGTVAAVLNQVRIKLVARAEPRPATVNQRLFLGNQVQTGQRSHMQALLLDRSAFTVGPNSRVTIDRFVYNPAGSSFSSSIAKGAMRFMSGTRSHGASRSISTPVATIGIRGTVVDTVVGEEAIAIARRERAVGPSAGGDPAAASLIVLRGPGPKVRGNVDPGAVAVSAGGKSVTLDRPLLAAYVPGPGAEPIGPFTISAPGQARVNDLILPPIEAVGRESREDPYLQRRRDDDRFVPVIPIGPGERPRQPPSTNGVSDVVRPLLEEQLNEPPQQP
jgi:hypothetical protein